MINNIFFGTHIIVTKCMRLKEFKPTDRLRGKLKKVAKSMRMHQNRKGA